MTSNTGKTFRRIQAMDEDALIRFGLEHKVFTVEQLESEELQFDDMADARAYVCKQLQVEDDPVRGRNR